MIHFKENKNKSALSTRWAQMSKQEQIIEKKKMEIQAKLEAQKQAAALAAQAKLSNPVINEDAGPNIFSNDGSFMSQYKALLEKQTKEKQEKEAKEKHENEEKARIEEEERPKPELIVMKEEMDHEINDHYNHTPNDRRQDRGSRERHRRWTDRSRLRPHSPITPVIEDRKKIIDTMNIPPLMQLSVRPPDDHSPPPSSIHNPWQTHEGTSSNDEYDPENNSHDNSHDDDCSEPAPVGPGSRGIMGPGPLNSVPMGSVGQGTMRPGPMGFGPMGPGPMSHGPMGPGQMGPGQMGPGQMGPGQMGPGQMGPGQMGPGQIGPGQMGPGQMVHSPMGPGSMMPGPMGSGPIRPGHMGANPNMPPGPHQGPGPNMGPGSSSGSNIGSGSLMGPGGPNMPPMPPFMSGPPNFNMPPNFMGPNGPCGPGPMPPNMCGPNMRGPGPNGPPPFFPPFNNSQMGNNGPPNSMNNLRFGPHGPNFGSRPPFGPNSSNFGPNNGPPNMGPPHMPFMPPNSMSDPKPLESIPPPEPMKLQNIPQPMPMTLNHIPPPNDMEPGNIPAPNPSQVLSADSFPAAVLRAATEVATNGDHWENVLKAIHSQDQNMWFLHNTNSIEYKAYRDLVHKMRGEGHGVNRKPEVKPEDKYEPEFSLEDDDSNDNRPIKQEYRDSNQDYYGTMKREQTSSQSDEDSDNKKERRKRKKSRWGDDPPVDIKPPGVVTPMPGVLPGAVLCKIEEDGMKLTNVNRNNQALMQYAMTNYGTTNLSVEDWKKCEDNFKLNLLYQDMLKKRQEVERLAAAGRHKYDYDSDEDVADGTWEHKLRAKEMNATEKWATELTKQAAGKHHIGDFLPPEELKKFMEKYSAFKSGKEPDFSDYKEYKLKEDNVGFKMLQKLGWNEGQGLGAEGTGIVEPINKAHQPLCGAGLGAVTPDGARADDDEFDAYRKRMMLAYRFRPNPLNNPRRPYY